MTDIIITPASGLIDFQNVSGISSATIQLDGSGNLNIGASAGDIQIGDTTSDVYIGNGVDNVDIVFEQDGEIRGLTGKTITLGQSDSFIAFGGNITGVTTFIGNIVAPTFTSTQTTGTAPFTVSSTTVVTNLNADLLDGQQGSYYNDLTNATGTLADARFSGTYTGVSFNSTGIATFTSFSGSGASLTNIPNGALDNSTVSYGGVTLSLGGSDATPAFNLADATGLPVSTGISGLGANVSTFLATPSSSNLAAAVTGETGSGALVFATSPTLVTPTLGNATATTINVSGVSTFGNNVNIAGTVGIGTRIDIVPYDTLSEGTLSFEGSAGQLFSITNNLTSGSIFSVNDVSGIPSIDVDADGTVLIAPYGSTEYVGIGTTNPTAKLDVNGTLNVSGVSTFVGEVTFQGGTITLGNANTDNVVFTADVNSSIVPNADDSYDLGSSTQQWRNFYVGGISASGIVTATDFNATSDINLKENIRPIQNSSEIISGLEGVRFVWKADGKESIGVIAQEVEKTLPELVSNGNTKTVNYNGLIGVLIEAVKDQQKQIDSLKTEIELLKSR